MEAFPNGDRGNDLRNLDLRHDSLPPQRSLGVYWNLEQDIFTFKDDLPEKPFTQRAVLSIVNSIYDPLGLAVPLLLEGRLLVQQLVIMGKKKNDNKPLGWDDSIPDAKSLQWKQWRGYLPDLEKMAVRHCYHPKDFGSITRAEIRRQSRRNWSLCVPASHQPQRRNQHHTAVRAVQSNPVQVTSIPRLELCAAVLAVQASTRSLKEIDMKIDDITYYTDSKVVLGYIQNSSRRF